MSRRRLLAGLGGLAATAALAPRSLRAASLPPSSTPAPRVAPLAGTAPRHLVWVWQFQHDGDPVQVRDTLAAHGLGIVVKVHDGTDWMSRYDKTPNAIHGPETVAEFARFFEDGGVPFHAWGLVKGRDPLREAEMASEVLNAGARSFFVDLEAHPGFFEGTEREAGLYGEALRRLQPNARVSTSIDPRPWEIARIPLKEFAGFTDEISPQVYWGFFDNKANEKKYTAGGITVPEEGITARFVMSTAAAHLSEFNRPIHPIGDGTVTDLDGWGAFIDESYSTAGAETVSLWRYGVATNELLALLRDTPPRVTSYVVAPGDTLGAIASKFGTSVDALVTTNGIANPNLISVGTRLVLPSGSRVPSGGVTPVSQPASGGGTFHVVEPGDTLFGISLRYRRPAGDIVQLNGISDPNLIRIGDRLRIP